MNPGGYEWVKNLSAVDKTIYVIGNLRQFSGLS